jgi:hypothetical protein
MTERLSTLMHDEATHLDVPPPPASTILVSGRRLVRRRRLTVGAAALTVTALAGVGLAVALEGPAAVDRGSETAANRSEDPTYGVVLASGSRVAVGDGRATVPGTVHDLVFTSEGALVRSNENGGASDGSGPEALTLVRPDGSTVDLGTIPEGVGPATDPSEPLYALAEKDKDGFVAVVRDVRTGEEVDRVALPDQPASYWELPPLALDGDHVYVGFKKGTWMVDRRTGQAQAVPGAGGGIPQVAGSRMVTGYGDSVSVIDVGTGEELLTVPIDGYGYGQLSPDGKNLLVTTEETEGSVEPSSSLHSLDTGASLELSAPDGGWSWAWTPDGNALSIGSDGLTVCDVLDGCSQQPLPDGFDRDVKPGGQRFES